MSSKKKSVLSTVIMLFFAWILVEGYLKPIPVLSVPAGSTREIHGSKEPGPYVDGAHGEEAVREAEAHGEEGNGEESWWRFSGWQIVFAVIGCFYFMLVLAWLPLLVARKTKGEVH
ncbi:MAG: hypothetical protein V3R93_07030 [Candidatus Hydrothermarchaeaceae archaeon]